MKCPACQFNNMPGPQSCVRCGARLQAPPGELFLPPRPTDRQRKLRRLARPIAGPADPDAVARARRRAQRMGAMGRWLRRFVNPDPTLPWWRHSPVLAGLLSGILPGSGHLYLGRVGRGLPVLAVAVVVALVATRYLWVPLGTWTLGLYCALGAWALLDCALRLPGQSAWQRYLLGLALVSALWLLLNPLAILGNRLWPFHELVLDAPLGPFSPGDHLTFERHAYDHALPEIGDVVLTRENQVNTVLGTPGDVVEWDGQTLWVNGALRKGIRPLKSDAPVPPFRATVRNGHYLVLPRALGDAVGETRAYESLVIPQAQIPRRDVLYRLANKVPIELSAEPTEVGDDGPGTNTAEIRE
jgi:hypothetical protein